MNQTNQKTVLGVPHGGTLIQRELTGDALAAALQRAKTLVHVQLGERETSDVEMIGIGALSPLTGFMGEADYREVVERMHLTNGLIWSLPVTLAVTPEQADAIAIGQEIALLDNGGELTALMQVTEKYTYDKQHEAQRVFGTTEDAHPGVARLYKQADIYLAGPIQVLKRPNQGAFSANRLTPSETRAIFAERGWKHIVAFQTRNPIHRAHEYIQKTALETVDGLLLHPLVGATKSDDIPADVRMRTYQEILARYYPADRVQLAVFPAAMRYAGPREAIWHAIARKNYGCTHFIVGRDHAGVGGYYGTYEAQQLISQFETAELGIQIFKFDNSFFCTRCGNMATSKTCPHDNADRVLLSGTQVRKMLRSGELPPPEFSRPEVARILSDAMREVAATNS